MCEQDYFYENYRFAKYYDDYYGRHVEDIPFWCDVVSNCDKVLELACGTGRITLPLIENKKEVFAIDYSEEMLEKIHKKNKSGNKVITSCQDMRNFIVGELFDAVIITANSINHLENAHDLLKCLHSCERCLKPNGILVFDALNPFFKFLTRKPNMSYDHDTFITSDTKEIINVFETSHYEKSTQINTVVYHYTDENGNTYNQQTKVRMYFPKELDFIIEMSPFRIINKYGWYDKREFDGKTNEQIYILGKKDRKISKRKFAEI